MTTANATTVKVGDVMLLVGYYTHEPKRVNVSRVTKAGWVRYTLANGTESELYKPVKGWNAKAGQYETNGRSAYLYTLDHLNELNARYASQAALQAEKKAEDDKRRAASNERHNNELAEVRKVFAVPTAPARTLADGSRVYTFTLPANPNNDRGDAIVMVRCKAGKDWSDSGKTVEANHTYVKATGSSFCSCSASYYFTDEEAILEAARSAYFAW